VAETNPRSFRRAAALVVAGVLAGGVLSVITLPGAAASTPSPQAASGAKPGMRREVVQRTKQVKVGDVDDTYASFKHPTFHPGSLHRLSAVDGHQHRKVVYVKFRVGGLPAHALIKHAVLRFTRERGYMPATTLRLYQVRSTHWSQANLDAQNRPHAVRRLAVREVTGRTRTVSLAVHDLRLRADHTYSFAVTSSDRRDVTRFRSRESGSGPRLRLIIKVPVIVMVPIGPGHGPVPTPTPAPTPTVKPTPTPTPTGTPTSPPPTTPANCSLSAILVPSCGVMLGGYLTSFGGSTVASALTDFNSQSGSTVSVDHDYRRPGQTLSPGDVQAAQMPNTLLLLNWKPASIWADANGGNATVNSQIDAMAQSIKALGSTKIFLTIFHEPENDVSGGASGCPSTIYKGSAGTPADYRAMWANVEARFAALNVTNVVWTMNYMGYSGWQCMVDDLWPGNSLVDWILWDPYASNNVTFAQSVSPFYNEMTSMSDAAHNYMSKPWGLGEFGDGSNSDANEQDFFSTVAQSLNANQFPKLKLLTLFDSIGTTGDYRVAYNPAGTWDAAKVADLQVLSQDPAIQGGRNSIAGG
jgi:hypothetical protein